MNFKVPWHVKGVHPEVRDSARAAARQAGMSVGEWLNSMILESAGDMAVPVDDSPRQGALHRAPPRDDRRTERPAAPASRRDGRRGEYDRVARGDRALNFARQDHDSPALQPAHHLASAIARLNQRMDEIIQDRRGAAPAPKPAQPSPVPQPPQTTSINQAFSDLGRERVKAASVDWSSNIDQAVAEISQRMRELDAEADISPRPQPPARGPERPGEPSSGVAVAAAARPDGIDALQDQLRKITVQIQALDINRTDEAIAALRNELAGIARTLIDASPRRAIEALEGEVRALAVQLDATRRTAHAPEFASLERGVAEVRDAVRSLAPAESLAGAVEAIHMLAGKIDQMAAAPRNSAAMEQLETAIAGLRGIASHAASSQALAALTSDVRAIAAKVDSELPGVARGNAILNSLEQRIATIADAIEQVRTTGQNTPPADLDHALQSLGDRMERLYSARGGSAEFTQLQDRLDNLVEKFDASESRLRSLDTIELGVKELFAYLDELRRKPAEPAAPVMAAPAIDSEILGQIEQRFERMSQRLDLSDSRLRSLDTIEQGIKELFGTLDTLRRNADTARAAPAPAFDPGVMQQLDRRIQGLAEKIDAAVARTDGLEAIERGMTAVLGHLRETRSDAPPPAPPQLPRVAAAERDIKPARAPGESAQESIGEVVDRLAMIEIGLRGGDVAPDEAPGPRSMASAAPMPAPPAADQKRTPASPIAPNVAAAARPIAGGALAHDYPLEPGSGKPQPGVTDLSISFATATVASPPIVPEPGSAAPASAAERIAASKAALESVQPAPADTGPRPNYIVAARRAAQAAAQGQRTGEADSVGVTADTTLGARASGIGKHIKSALFGICVLVILASAIHLAVNYFESRTASLDPPKPQSSLSAPGTVSQSALSTEDDPERELIAKFIRPEDPSGGSAGVLPEPPPAQFGIPSATKPEVQLPAVETAGGSTVPIPKIIEVPVVPAPSHAGQKPPSSPDLTGSVAPLKLVPPPEGLFASQPLGRVASLPSSIGGKSLVAAAEGGDPAAAYEVALRFAEGRGVAVSAQEAAAWFEHAARAGVVPALFRLGGHHEKGIGVKKDLNRARDLYVAAANSGNAKSMHNLAVIYAEGLDGKPDYATAIVWFRKGASFGVADSQYNLGVLYARGIGVEQNLAESFKWFALAALQGDQDAAQKRDDVAKRLDPQTLNAARQAVQSWVAEPQPEEAVLVRTPPGGWDQGVAPSPARKAKASRV